MQIDGKYHSDYHSYPKREYQYTGGTKEDAEEVRKDEQSGTSRGKWQGDSGVIVELSNQNNLVKESINAGREAGSENTASFILSVVGLTSSPSKVSRCLPLAIPVITRIISFLITFFLSPFVVIYPPYVKRSVINNHTSLEVLK